MAGIVSSVAANGKQRPKMLLRMLLCDTIHVGLLEAECVNVHGQSSARCITFRGASFGSNYLKGNLMKMFYPKGDACILANNHPSRQIQALFFSRGNHGPQSTRSDRCCRRQAASDSQKSVWSEPGEGGGAAGGQPSTNLPVRTRPTPPKRFSALPAGAGLWCPGWMVFRRVSGS